MTHQFYKTFNLFRKVKFIFSLGLLLLFSTLALAQNTDKTRDKTLVLKYEDFAPQALAYELIGYEFYQWNSHGSSNPNEKDVIFVVVYRDIDLEEVKAKYPVIKDKSDYRYLEYDKAIKFINEKINEWEKIESTETEYKSKELYRELIEQYKKTQRKIVIYRK